ncbi:MAG: glycerol-3-phosphate dehydrogenase/oxidase [Candidatus Omnitrophica bacterium]|nr:glycerol-3-phosphate dehydrogenase/oxidase [Candidatus Omnitrophota bacterium]
MVVTQRAQRIAQLAATPFDVLVVGGGIVGAGIARDAVMRGLSVALVEQGDFAGGTSSKTSKLIHGGLRYLEHGQLRLVFESLRERRILRAIAPAVVHPFALMIPVYSHSSRPAWKINAGLTLYDLLAWRGGLPAHKMVLPQRAAALEPALRVDGLRVAGVYMDCQMDDARLCLANVLQAQRFGAVCLNYARLLQWLRRDGALCGGVVGDRIGGRTVEVRARMVINATGPWADGVRRLDDPHAPLRLAPTKGIHLVVRQLAQTAVLAESRRDRHLFFILPWAQHSIVGTTESVVGGSLDDLRATPEEVAYLLEEANRVLPGSHLTPEDVLATFAGARPLLAFSGTPTAASREHRIEVSTSGLISVMGGKYTTYRVMARQAVEMAMRCGRFSGERCLTDQVHLMEPVHSMLLDQVPELIRLVDPDTLSRLVNRYGAGTLSLLHVVGADAALADRLCPHHEWLAAEGVYAIQQEMACTITDVMARRLPMAWSACHGLDALPAVEELLQRYGGFSPHQTAEQAEDYLRFLSAAVSFREQAVGQQPVQVGRGA